jgi:hypothetical protein
MRSKGPNIQDWFQEDEDAARTGVVSAGFSAGIGDDGENVSNNRRRGGCILRKQEFNTEEEKRITERTEKARTALRGARWRPMYSGGPASGLTTADHPQRSVERLAKLSIQGIFSVLLCAPPAFSVLKKRD